MNCRTPWVKRIVTGLLENELYKLLLDYFSAHANVTSILTLAHFNKCCNNTLDKSIYISESNLWHSRLGRILYSKAIHIPDIRVKKNKGIYNVCFYAKQQRKIFSKSQIHTNMCFQLIHMDLRIPYKYKSFNGATYFLTIVDDFSRAT